MLNHLDHVGIIVPSTEAADHLMGRLGIDEVDSGYISEYQAVCIFAGEGGQIEIIIPDPGSKLASFNRGAGGLHHIALGVSSLSDLTNRLAVAGVPMLERAPIRGATDDFSLNFISPAHARGVIVEFVERD